MVSMIVFMSLQKSGVVKMQALIVIKCSVIFPFKNSLSYALGNNDHENSIF